MNSEKSKSPPRYIRNDGFNFVAPISIETCYARLHSLKTHRRTALSLEYTDVEIEKIADSVYEFRIYQQSGRNIAVTSRGQFMQQLDNLTLVKGQVAISGESRAVIGFPMMILMLGFIFIVVLSGRLTIGLPFLIPMPFLLSLWIHVSTAKEALKEQIVERLSKPGS